MAAGAAAFLPIYVGIDRTWKDTGKATKPWPDSVLLDDRFIRSFASWAPERR